MLTYASGAPVEVGDAVLIEHGRTPGTIVEIVESAAQFADFNVTEPGVMVKSGPFGLVYLPVKWLAEDPLEFVARGAVL
jgi:hypothetical protein